MNDHFLYWFGQFDIDWQFLNIDISFISVIPARLTNQSSGGAASQVIFKGTITLRKRETQLRYRIDAWLFKYRICPLK